MKPVKLLPLLLLPLFLLGCSSVPKPKYTVLTPGESVALPMDYTSLSARLAADIRSAPNPLRFHEDGSVSLCRELTYYAPIEVAVNRALQDSFSQRKAEGKRDKTLRVLIRSFGVDERDGKPKAAVFSELPDEGISALVKRDLPENYTAADLRNALGDALLQSVIRLCDSLERTAQPQPAE